MTPHEMLEAIQLMEKTVSDDPARTPQVGAVVAIDGEPIAAAHRGNNDHAEKLALHDAGLRRDLSGATVYTTLEPCTRRVRTLAGESCTERLIRAQVKKVVIGILDPNQGVCGKGVLELQAAKIEIELFPHDLAQRIRQLNDPFIQAQQSLGVRIHYPKNGEPFRGQRCVIGGKFINPPGDNVLALTNIGDYWWHQPHPVRVVPEGDRDWEVAVYFGVRGLHKIYVVKASDLGMAFVEYYRRVVARQHQLIDKASREFRISEETARSVLGSGYLGFTMATLPKGLDLEDCITADVQSLES